MLSSFLMHFRERATFVRLRPRSQSPAGFALLALVLAFSAPRLGAEELWSESGFYVDLPEGFSLAEGDGKTRFSFVDPSGGMEFDILRYPASRHPSAKALAEESLKKLGAKGEREDFVYEGREAVFAELAFALGGAPKRGYAVFIGARAGPRPAGAQAFGAPGGPGAAGGGASVGAATPSPQPAPEALTALLAFTDEESFEGYADFILSCLDSFSADRAARRSPGPLSQYLLPFPAPPGAETRRVRFGEAEFELPFSPEESEQVSGTAGREFRVLQAYGDTEDLWKAAWARCFRMIYRESARRLDRLALEVSRLLPEDDPTQAARMVLAWVQGFVYERDQEGIDFVEPLVAAYEGRGDCDSRALLMAVILERVGIDVILMLSRDFSHAMAAVDVPGGGQRFPWEGRDWLVAETTDKVGLGLIAKKQLDWRKWIGVGFGD